VRPRSMAVPVPSSSCAAANAQLSIAVCSSLLTTNRCEKSSAIPMKPSRNSNTSDVVTSMAPRCRRPCLAFWMVLIMTVSSRVPLHVPQTQLDAVRRRQASADPGDEGSEIHQRQWLQCDHQSYRYDGNDQRVFNDLGTVL